MAEERTMRVGGLIEQIEHEAKNLVLDFREFTIGTRCLMLLHRTKDGGENKEYHRRNGIYVTHNTNEYLTALINLLSLKALSVKPYRLYASCNPRDIKKAERAFKMDMLMCDFDDGENKDFFWARLESKWVSALMAPGSRKSSKFLIDVDGSEKSIQETLKWLEHNKVVIYKQYQTPNGWHVVTAPFNPNDFNVPDAEIKKDGLLLIKA